MRSIRFWIIAGLSVTAFLPPASVRADLSLAELSRCVSTAWNRNILGLVPVEWTPVEREAWQAWIRENPELHHLRMVKRWQREESAVLLSQLPDALYAKLMTRGDSLVLIDELRDRMAALGLPHGLQKCIEDQWELRGATQPMLENALKQTRQAIADYRRLPQTDRAHALAELKIFSRRDQARQALGNPNQAAYEIKVEGAVAVFPDGARYKVVAKAPDGTLYLELPRDRFMPTQGGIDSKRVGEYMGDKELEAHGITQPILADGRVLPQDEHHRASAYSATHDGNLKVEVPAINGKYYAATHMEYFNFYSLWNDVPLERRNRILDLYATDPAAGVEAMRTLFYEVTRRSRL